MRCPAEDVRTTSCAQTIRKCPPPASILAQEGGWSSDTAKLNSPRSCCCMSDARHLCTASTPPKPRLARLSPRSCATTTTPTRPPPKGATSFTGAALVALLDRLGAELRGRTLVRRTALLARPTASTVAACALRSCLAAKPSLSSPRQVTKS